MVGSAQKREWWGECSVASLPGSCAESGNGAKLMQRSIIVQFDLVLTGEWELIEYCAMMLRRSIIY